MSKQPRGRTLRALADLLPLIAIYAIVCIVWAAFARWVVPATIVAAYAQTPSILNFFSSQSSFPLEHYLEGWSVRADSVLLWMYTSWHGPIPPQWQHEFGVDAGMLAFFGASTVCALAVFAPFCFAYLVVVESPTIGNLIRHPWALTSAVAGLILSLAFENNADKAAGRWGGYFWLAISATPQWHHCSLLVVAGATVGGLLLGAMSRGLFLRRGSSLTPFWSGSVIAWLLTTRSMFRRFNATSSRPSSCSSYFGSPCACGGRNGFGPFLYGSSSPAKRRSPWRRPSCRCSGS